MLRFLLSWLACAVVLAAVAWFGTPGLKKSAPGSYDAMRSFFKVPSASAPAAAAAGAESAEDPGGASASDAAPDSSPRRAQACAPAEERTAPADVPDAGAGQGPAPADAPVAVDPRAATNADPGFPWGVIVTNSFCYDPALKRLGRLPGGTVVAWTGKRATPIGEVADVYVMRNREWQPNRRALLVSDLILFEGATYAETDPSQRDPVIDWCAAYGKLEQLRADAAKASSGPVAGNPYQQEYDAAKTKFDSVQNEVNAVMSKIRWSDTHELPGGLRERGELMRRAQALRPLQNDARRAFLEIEDKYNSWAETEGRKRESSSAASDRALRMKMLEEEMERLRPAVQSVVPGI